MRSALATSQATSTSPATGESAFKDAFLAEIRKAKVVFYQTVVAQAQKIDVSADRIAFSFSPTQRALRDQFEQNRAWLETLAQQASGRKIVVAAESGAAETKGAINGAADEAASKKSALREKALADSGVQAMLEVFPAEIRDVEEI